MTAIGDFMLCALNSLVLLVFLGLGAPQFNTPLYRLLFTAGGTKPSNAFSSLVIYRA